MSGYPLIRPDAGRAEVDLILTGMERQIYDVYRQAAVEMRKKAEAYLAFYEKTEAVKREQVAKGTQSQAEYRQWCISHMLTGRRYYEMSEVLATDMTNYDKIAASIINGHLPDVYACGFNYALYQAEIAGGFQTSFSLYDRGTVERLLRDEPDLLPIQPKVNVSKDMRWNKKQIASSMMQSILQGESVPQIAARMAKHCAGVSESTAVRNARTAVTAAENGGRNDRYKQLKAAGVDMEIEWSATLDSRTRLSHRELDGQRRPPDKPFYVDGVEVEYPGDPSAPQYLIWNCRCTMLAWIKGFAPSEVIKSSPKLDVSYEEWKAGKDIERSSGKTKRDDVNPDNPSYGYSGRNPARIKPGAADRRDTAAEVTIPGDSTPGQYGDQPIQRKGLTTSGESGTMETEGQRAIRNAFASGITSQEIVNGVIAHHRALAEFTPTSMKTMLEALGYEVRPLGSKSSLKGIPFEQGGGYRVIFGGDGYFQYHPARGSHHRGAYWKIRNGKEVHRYDMEGNPKPE